MMNSHSLEIYFAGQNYAYYVYFESNTLYIKIEQEKQEKKRKMCVIVDLNTINRLYFAR